MPNLIDSFTRRDFRAKGASPYAGTAGGTYAGGQGSLDYFKRDASPSPIALVRENLGTAYACSGLNADLVAKTRLRLYEKTSPGGGKSLLNRYGRTKALSDERQAIVRKNVGHTISDSDNMEEVTDHPAIELIRRPNPLGSTNDGSGMNAFALMEATQLFQETVGRVYWYCEKADVKFGGRAMGRIPKELWLLAPQWVTEWPGFGENQPIIAYYQFAAATGTSNNYAPEDVVAFRMIDMATGGYSGGMSPLRAVFEQARLARFADGLTSARVQNGGRPDAMFIPGGDEFGGSVGLDEAQRLELMLRSRYRMAGAGSIVVSDIPGKLEPITWPINDVIDSARYNLTREQIAEGYHVPMTKLKRDGANRASAESGEFAHCIDAGLPRLRRNEAAMNSFFLPMYGEEAAERLFFAYDDPPGLVDPAERMAKYTLAVNRGAITINQQLRDLAADEIGPEGDKHLVPSTVVALNPDGTPMASSKVSDKTNNPDVEDPAKTDAISPPVPVPNKSKKNKGNKLLAIALGKLADAVAMLEKKNADESEVGEVGAKAIIPTPENPAPEFAPSQADAPHLDQAMRRFFRVQRDAVLAELEKAETVKWFRKKDESDKTDAEKELAEAQIEKAVPVLDLTAWTQPLVDVAYPYLLAEAQEATRQTIAALEKAVTPEAVAATRVPQLRLAPDLFTVVDRNLPKATQALTLKFADSTNETTTKELSEALDELRGEIEQGIITGDTRAEIRKRVQTVFENADNSRATVIAHTEASNARHSAQVMTAKDSRVVKAKAWLASADACPVCLGYAARGEIPLDADFGETSYGPVKHAPGHPRCYCSITFVLHDSIDESLVPDEKGFKEAAHAPAGSPNGGQFVSSGGGASGAVSSARHATPTGSDGGKLQHLVELPVKLEHAVTHAVTHAAKAMVSYVQELAQGGPALEAAQSAPHGSIIGKVATGVNLLAKGGMKAAFLPWIAGNKAVELVARAKGIEEIAVKGLSEPEVSRVKSICAGYDVLACKAVFLGLEHTSLKHLASASTFIPMASTAYLAYSTATNPIATWKAAKGAVKSVADKFRKPKKSFDPTDTKDAVAKLCDAAKAHSGDDYFFACLTEAIEETGEHGGDIADAIELAEAASKVDRLNGKGFETEARDSSGQWTSGGSLGAFAGDAAHEAAADFAENVNSNLATMEPDDAVSSAMAKVPKEHQAFVEAHEQRVTDAANDGHVDPRTAFSETDEGVKAIPAHESAKAVKTANETFAASVAGAQSFATDLNAKYAEAKETIRGMSKDLNTEYQASLKGDKTGEVEIDEHAMNATKKVLEKLPEHIRSAFTAEELADALGSADGKIKASDLMAMAEDDGELPAKIVAETWKSQPQTVRDSIGKHSAELHEKLATDLYTKGKIDTSPKKVLGDTAEHYANDAATAAVDSASEHGKGRLSDEHDTIASELADAGSIDEDFFKHGHH